MSAATNYTENNIMNALLGGASLTVAANTYIGLYTAGPGETGGGTEVSGTGYARVNLTNNTTNWPTISGTDGTKANATIVTFPTALASWGTATHFGIFDASTGGNLLVYSSLQTAKAIDTGDTPSFAVGALTVTLA